MSDRTIYVKVWDKKRKLERTVTKAAYKILAGKTYDLLEGDVEDPTPAQKKREEDVKPVADEAQEVTSTAAEINPVVDVQTEGIKVIRKKPGPKPKNNA